MASQSDSPPNSIADNTQNPGPQVAESTVEDRKDAKTDPSKEISPPSVFVNSEPIREDQVQNAVKFLSHPKVRGSPVMYRRSFLERKGLTKEEIDEAFRRVPDPTPSVTTAQLVVTNQDGQLKSSSTIQPQGSTQTLQPSSATPSGSISKMGTLSRFHWSHALLAVSLLAVSGAGTAVLFKKSILPRFKSWIRKAVFEEGEGEEALVRTSNLRPNLAEEATAAAKAAAAAAADVARASQEILISKTEEKRYFQELTNLLDVQIREMKSMSNALHKFEGQTSINGRFTAARQHDQRVLVTNSRQSYANGRVDVDVHSGRSSSPPTSVEPSVAPHPKSYMEIMAMVDRGEKPSNIREINDQPPIPNQPVPNPRSAPKPKPWEVGQSQNGSSNGLQYQESGDGFDSGFLTNQLNGEGSNTPWWQQNNARITEIGTEGEQKIGSTLPIERPVQRSWVPPQPPPVAMAEAAAAIRQPKKPVIQREQTNDDQLLARSSEISDELQRITKLSESGGIEANGGSPAFNATEIQREEENSQIES